MTNDVAAPDLSGAKPSLEAASAMANDMINSGRYDPADISEAFEADYGIRLARSGAAPFTAPVLPAGSAANGTSHPHVAPAGGSFSPEQAQAAIADLKRDDAFAQKLAAGDAAATAKWRELHQAAHRDDSGAPVYSAETKAHIETVEAIGGTVDPQEIGKRASEIEWPAHIGADAPDGGLDQKLAINRELVKLGFDRVGATSLVATVAEGDARIQGMNPEQVEVHVAEQRAMLQRAWGSDFEPRVKQIEAFIGKLPEHVQQWVEDANILRDALAVSAIWKRIKTGQESLANHRNKPRS